jgi:predicted TIM-barrel fold metal-dependent hydrolase
MNVTLPKAQFLQKSKLQLIDCDIHPRLRSMEDLKPYLATRWWDTIQTYGLRKRHGFVKGHPYPKSQPGDGARRDSWPENGDPSGSSLPLMQQQHLDHYGIDIGVMNPLWPGSGDQNMDLSAALASAHNDWQLDLWHAKEPRLRPSIVVPYENIEASVAEIHKRAANKSFCQVFMLSRTNEALGRKKYWPIYEAAVQHNLPIGIHVFGFSGIPISSSGWPSFYIEEMAEHGTACSALITSMIMEGLFERFPTLKIVMIEAGFGWIPSLGWRLDKSWKHMKDEVPHLKRAPSEYLKEHIFVTTQPIEEPERPEHLIDLIDWIGWDRVMFASDYAHWDFDDPIFSVPPNWSEERRKKIYSENAMSVFRF